ncbi:EARP-interacting protein homolog [Tachysurus ichikawai]
MASRGSMRQDRPLSIIILHWNETTQFSVSDSRVLTCAAVWRMPPEWESGSHDSPDDSAHSPQALQLLCHLDNTAHGNVAW